MASPSDTFCTDSLPQSARASALSAEIEATFPGMRVQHIPGDAYASVGRVQLARGTLFEIETSRKELYWSPPSRGTADLYLLLTVRGEARVSHAGREARLADESFAFIDGTHPFELSVADDSSHVLLQLPLRLVRSNGWFGEDTLARASSPLEAGDLFLGRALRSLATSARSMSSEQRAIAEHALLSLLPLASVLRREPPLSPWVRRAFVVLEASALDTSFDANVLADTLGVSRRYLDRLFSSVHTTVSREIWERRLRAAASELTSPLKVHRTILEVALSTGFADAAHFSRAFRRRFGCTPSEWRRRG